MIKGVLAGVGAIGLLLAASGVQAQNGLCALTNWSSTVAATTLSVGTVADGNHRYAGPCGLRVVLDSAEAYLIDTTPVDETVFNVRFYFFLKNIASDVVLYQAMDGNDAAFGAKFVDSTDSISASPSAMVWTATRPCVQRSERFVFLDLHAVWKGSRKRLMLSKIARIATIEPFASRQRRRV